MNALIDNDILLKGSCVGLLGPLIGRSPGETGVLGAARYVLPPKIRRFRTGDPGDAALGELMRYIESAIELEPTGPEAILAADLELMAQTAFLEFDAGESQLCAILITRMVPALLTGDKRAISALERLVDLEPRTAGAAGKIYCLEQLVTLLLGRLEVDTVREAVCREPIVDRALAICFSCSSSAARQEAVLLGLASYIESVRADAGRVLAPDP